MIRKYLPTIGNKLIQISGGEVAHHGIQRSGTNYLNQCLIKCNQKPLNTYNENRNSPKHKHCRWYVDKSDIPPFLREQYHNTFIVDNVKSLNKIAGYPEKTKHIIIKKQKLKWLASIMNYGIRCKWFNSREDAIQNLDILISDYNSYYKFWDNIMYISPYQVKVVLLENLQKDFNYFREILDELGLKSSCGTFNGNLIEVPMSPKNRLMYVSEDDIKELCLNC